MPTKLSRPFRMALETIKSPKGSWFWLARRKRCCCPSLSLVHFTSCILFLTPFFNSELGTEIIYFTVGAEKAEFSIHKQLLFSVASIFEEHLAGANIAGRITIPDEFPAMFRLFVNYSKSFRIILLHWVIY